MSIGPWFKCSKCQDLSEFTESEFRCSHSSDLKSVSLENKFVEYSLSRIRYKKGAKSEPDDFESLRVEFEEAKARTQNHI